MSEDNTIVGETDRQWQIGDIITAWKYTGSTFTPAQGRIVAPATKQEYIESATTVLGRPPTRIHHLTGKLRYYRIVID